MRFSACLALVLSAAALAGCAKKRVVVVPPAPSIDPVAVDCLWLDPKRGRAIAENADLAAAWFETLKARNVDGIYMQTWGPGEEDQSWQPAFILAARGAGLRTIAAVPLFLGSSDGPDRAPVALRDGPLPWECSSPAQPAARIEALRRIRAAAVLDADALCFTHAGFPSADTDFSEDARFAYESVLGRPVATWPDSVATVAPDGSLLRGPLWDGWTVWRAGILHDFMGAARAEAERSRSGAGLRPVPVMLMASGLYPLHAAEGPNWADAGEGTRGAWPEAPRAYEFTAVGQGFDAIVLQAFAPFATSTDARGVGMEWWSSCEGALAVARKATARPLAIAVAKAAWGGEDGTLSAEEEQRWKVAESAIRGLGVPVLFVE